jgi:hypothetical protein
MQGLASFVMRGRSQAALVASAAAVLSLIVPVVGLFSSAAVALVTLRQGALEGLVVGLFAGLASGLFAFAVLGSPLPAIGFALALWLPVWALAVVLRHSLSLALAIQMASVIGLLVVIALRLQSSDPAEYWAELLEPLRENLVQNQVIDADGSRALVAKVALWMTGAFAATFYFQALLALFIGRWWQALLYKPGGFGAEFRELRLGRTIGFLSLGLMLILLVRPEARWAADLLLLLTPLLFLQGVAVVHGLANGLGVGRGWLIGFYLLLVVTMPHAPILVSGLGLVDIWLDVRVRFGKGGRSQD